MSPEDPPYEQPAESVVTDQDVQRALDIHNRMVAIEAELRESLDKASGSMVDEFMPRGDEGVPADYIRTVHIPAATDAVRELCGENFVPYDTNLFIRYLDLLRKYGEYQLGGEMADLFWETHKAGLPEQIGEPPEYSVLWLAKIVGASWMHYANTSSASRKNDTFAIWCDRTREVSNRLNAQLTAIMGRDKQEDINLRKQLLIVQLRMDLTRARAHWRKGYHFGDTSDERLKESQEALDCCRYILNGSRAHLQDPATDASEVAKEMVRVLRADDEYLALVAEVQRAKAGIIQAGYTWKLGMGDVDIAEEVAGEIENYARHLSAPADGAELKPAQEDEYVDTLLRKYLQFYESRPGLEKPDSWWYTRFEQGRREKILGNHNEAHVINSRITQSARQGQNVLLISRTLNNAADNLVVLARKLRTPHLDSTQTAKLADQARAILNSPETHTDSLAQKLLYKAVETAEEASKSCDDRDTRRIARLTISDAKLNLIPLMPLNEEGMRAKRKALREVWAMFAKEVEYYESDEDNPDKFDDPLWQYSEASVLARVSALAKNFGIEKEINVLDYCDGDDTRFREAHTAISEELAFAAGKISANGGVPGDRTNRVPGWSGYYELVVKKADILEKVFPSLA